MVVYYMPVAEGGGQGYRRGMSEPSDDNGIIAAAFVFAFVVLLGIACSMIFMLRLPTSL
jgi:hypothetical protein